MRYFTPQLVGFGVTTLVLSIGFFSYLYSSIKAHTYDYIWIAALAFGVLMFFNGLLWGWRDSVRKSKSDLGFMYHLYTFVIVNNINLIFLFFFGFLEKYNENHFYLYILFWGIGLMVHYYAMKKKIKGMDKEELFV